MKIAIYYPWIYLKSGVERTILETVKRSKHSYTIFTNYFDESGTFPEFKNLNVVELKKIPVRRNLYTALVGVFTILFQKIYLDRYDLFIVHSEGFADLILFRNRKTPTLCFCYTPLRPVFDSDNMKRVLDQKIPLLKVVYGIFIHIFRIIDRRLWQNYSHIIFISKESLRRARTGKLINKKLKFDIVYPGIEWRKNIQKRHFEKFFFLPGRITWSKNIELAIKSFNLLSKNKRLGNRFKLIIAGHVDIRNKAYFRKLKHLAAHNPNVKFVLNPDDSKLHHLYLNCYTVLATAFNEDWGLTPVEANSFGKPVLALSSGGYKESQKNNITGFLVNNNPEQLAKKMLTLATNEKLARRIGDTARKYSKKFSWVRFIKEYENSLKRFA